MRERCHAGGRIVNGDIEFARGFNSTSDALI
jgi:hypothetical protein